MVSTPSLLHDTRDALSAPRDETTAPRASNLTRPEHPTLGAFTHDATPDVLAPGPLFDSMFDMFVTHDGSLIV